ncbi:PREDICTED: probable protein phosphatase 2C 62 [Nelumbo nucifera]|uniref:protein-serine/threonine phosphatase n=1 Tax=Nelumbo nucifera TaxID=4432 RepID=A0A1U8QC40_NELNU|nr:PREDICTED: probable protein phosphatase 2C 62 [Nelumbo nucifera]
MAEMVVAVGYTEQQANPERKNREKVINDFSVIRTDEKETSNGTRKDKNNERKKAKRNPSGRCFTHGFHLVKGKMNHEMEDYVVAETRRMKGAELGLYAIFDGHSGRAVPKYLESHLFDNILDEPGFLMDMKSAIRRAFGITDDEVLERVGGRRGGSTAVTAILINGEKLVVANVGDSRAVLCKKGVAKQLSVDHEPQKEKDAIESKGGFVSKKRGNVPRVDGQLAMSRAFGDGSLKEHITSEPDIIIETIGMDVEFIILASDGLWKEVICPSKCFLGNIIKINAFVQVISNQEAVDCIRDMNDSQEAAEQLIEEALSRNSRDDISCIVVSFL